MDGALTMGREIRIGGGGGFWGDSPEGARQIVERGDVDYLVMDYLAEITMSILARMKAKDPGQGYAPDFVTRVMAPLARQIADKGIKVVTNAGGLNTAACRTALEAVFAQAGVALKVAIVEGDDISALADRLRADGVTEMFSGAAMPERISSMNAYLGAGAIAKALDEGADVVLTGRVVDSATVLGPLIHEFGWGPSDFDRLSGGSLAGHLLECGPQVTGGIFTDWQDVPGWDDTGFPIAICREDGSFDLTKVPGTGGLVSPRTVAEQVCYEVGDPASYLLPDVTCDWSGISLSQAGSDVVRVAGAKGRAPGKSLKVSATYPDGFRSAVTMMIAGRSAAAKAQATGEAILKRAGRLLAERNIEPFSETMVEVLGADASYGADPMTHSAREVVLKLAVRHDDAKALNIFAGEIYPAACSMAQGITGFAGGRPAPQPVIRLFSCLVDRDLVPVTVDLEGRTIAVPHPKGQDTEAATVPTGETAVPKGSLARVPLIALAHGRSGDKGDKANIGVLARDPAYLPWIRRSVTEAAVAQWFGHFVKGSVTRYEWPGLQGFNFLMDRALGGGGVASLRHDPQGKALAQVLLDLPVEVPADWIAPGGPLSAYAEEAVPA
ncbi:acyclic terpene utilization AtuA family protein [Chachezhania sediminis]|uniref:acyclic terpene utilization AtuA family protein n=1 Tax=Chachezhania sediminis TaxID=2599291 RepID=UPI001E2D02CF|nr:acyclic terpene utilization AtuA family protein [Chachezhania sediminis]